MDESALVKIVVPSALQMGWTESPPYFLARMETCRDIIDVLLKKGHELPEHLMEYYMLPARPAKRHKIAPEKETSVNVFVDDFCLAAVETEDGKGLLQFSQAALNTIHDIFPPPEVLNHEGGKDSMSEKKLEHGDTRWDPKKKY